MNRAVFALVAILCLLSLSLVTGLIQVVGTDGGTIYINADGSISPSTAPIHTADNVTYTFAGNLNNDSIMIEKDNVVIDGSGYTVQGTNALDSVGIDLTGRSNVTVKNMNVFAFNYGIDLSSSSNNKLSGLDIANNTDGIYLNSSSYNSVSGNNITANNDVGISLSYDSSNNIVIENNLTANHYDGIYFDWGNNNNVSGNTFANDGLGVYASYMNYVENNTVNGEPLVYLENVANYSVSNAGEVILVDCNNITVENLNLSHTAMGVELWQTSNSSISGNTIGNNNVVGIDFEDSSNNNSVSGNNITENYFHGVLLDSSSNNSISGNNIMANNQEGILLRDDSSYKIVSGNNIIASGNYGILLESANNSIYHNNFVNSTHQAGNLLLGSTNVWDDGHSSGGNYWSDYNGTDANHDGIGDTPYVIDVTNIDHYPLMGTFSDFNATSQYQVQTISNSTISNFQFNVTAVSFNASGESGTTGFCRICIPTALINGTFTVFVNGTEIPYTLLPESNSTQSYLYFAYHHSIQELIITPEFSSFLILPLFLIATLLTAMIYKKRPPRTT